MAQSTQSGLDYSIAQVHQGNVRPFIENFVSVTAKNNALVPFRLNRLQTQMDALATGRDYWIKYRQGGSSVYNLAKLFSFAVCIPHFTAAAIGLSTDSGRTVARMFRHVEQFVETMPPEFRPAIEHRRERYIEFRDTQSQMFIGTVGSREFGRSETYHALLVTELGSFTPQETENVLTSAIESVVPGGIIIFETTPKLMGSPAHLLYLDAKGGRKPYNAHFFPWWLAEDYHLARGSFEALPADRAALTLTEEEARVANRFEHDGVPVEDRIRWRRAKMSERGDDFYAEYPEDELSCVAPDTVVLLPDGKTDVISHLAAQDYKGEVVTVASDGYLTTSRVTNWYRSPRRGRRVYRLTYKHAKMAHGIRTRAVLTQEHQVLTLRGWVSVSEMVDGDRVATGTPAPSAHTMQLILGMVLGDSSITRRNTLATAQTDKELVGLRARMLAGFVPHTKNYAQSGLGSKHVYAFNTKPTPFWAYLRTRFYPEGAKRVPKDLIAQLDDFGIATWFMDDGHTRPQRGTMRPVSEISTGVLPIEDVQALCDVLNAKGYECNVRKHWPRYHKVQFTTAGTQRLLHAISPYIVPSMRYKLRGMGEPFNSDFYEPEPTETFWDEAKAEEIPVPMVHRKGRLVEKHSTFYCMDVDATHNFVTLGGVVHNCWLAATQSVFPQKQLRAMMDELRKPSEEYEYVRVYKTASDVRTYCIGIDAAGGIPGGDLSGGVLLCAETGEVAAVLHGLIGPEEFARRLAELGRRYGGALIGGERDSWTLQTMQWLDRLGYPNVFYAEDDGKTPSMGFQNTHTSRLQAVSALREAIKQGDFRAYDEGLVGELVRYQRKSENSGIETYSAPSGMHDDLCVAAQRAQQLRLSMPVGGAFAVRIGSAGDTVISYPPRRWGA